MIPLSNLPNPTRIQSIRSGVRFVPECKTPTVPSVDVYNKHEMLAAAVIPDTPAYIEPIEFNKDIGFTGGYNHKRMMLKVTSLNNQRLRRMRLKHTKLNRTNLKDINSTSRSSMNHKHTRPQQYEAQGYEPQQYEAQAYETQGYEAQGYESQNPEIQQYETQQTDTQQYEPQTSNEEQAQATTYESYDAYQPQEDAQQPLHFESGDFEQEQAQQSYAHSQYEQTLVNDQKRL